MCYMVFVYGFFFKKNYFFLIFCLCSVFVAAKAFL